MKQDNVARAFAKVKEDMLFLKTEIEVLKKEKPAKKTKKSDEGVDKLEKSIDKLQKSLDEHIRKTQNTFSEMAEDLSEKINLEINGLRMEFREDLLELEQKNMDEDLY